MGDIVFHQHPVPQARGHGLQVQKALIFHFLNCGKEVVVIVGWLNWVRKVPFFLYIPLVQGFMVLAMKEGGEKSSL